MFGHGHEFDMREAHLFDVLDERLGEFAIAQRFGFRFFPPGTEMDFIDAKRRAQGVGLLPQPDGVMQLVTVPIALGRTNPEILGTVSVGFLLDDAFAAQLKTITGSEIAFGIDGQILATTLPHADRAELSALLGESGVSRSAHVGGDDYVALPRPLAGPADPVPAGGAPVALHARRRLVLDRRALVHDRAYALVHVRTVGYAGLTGARVAVRGRVPGKVSQARESPGSEGIG